MAFFVLTATSLTMDAAEGQILAGSGHRAGVRAVGIRSTYLVAEEVRLQLSLSPMC
jgi:hypothetical protein